MTYHNRTAPGADSVKGQCYLYSSKVTESGSFRSSEYINLLSEVTK